DEVPTAQLSRVDAEPVGEDIERPLTGKVGLDPARSAHCPGRGLVGKDAIARDGEVGPPVGAREVLDDQLSEPGPDGASESSDVDSARGLEPEEGAVGP